MWLKIIVPFGFMLIVSAAMENSCNLKPCSKDVDNEKAVCGSDGLTYPNRCSFEKARCANNQLTLAKRGPCRKQKVCHDWEVYRHSNPEYRFQASCRSDGTYASAQCHPDAEICWCVTPQGIPLPYTSVRWKPDVKPHCGRKKKSTRRRSPNRKGRSRVCEQPDKAKFNHNLINIFYTEWGREQGITRQHYNETDAIVIQWKFRNLDANNDSLLDKNEYRDLKRVAKKAVKPKRCAKNFIRLCDINSDALISRQEWAECLTQDGMDDGGSNPSISDENYEDSDYFLRSATSTGAPPDKVLNNETSSEIRDDDPTDCLSDRKAALGDGYQFYIPECTPDGRYEKVQCYMAAGYCFCVNEDNGKYIPGTSVKNGTPQCDHLSNVNRPMRGCPDEKKSVFLKDLLQFLHTRMSEIINGTKSLNGLPWISSKEEQAATWSFVVFDKNKNKLLDRNEWKAFKETVTTVKSLRKCGKKLPRYCDINKDRHISMTEWLDCLNVQVVASNTRSSRVGKNPLSILQED